MDIEVKLIDLAEGVTQGDIVRVCVKRGDTVSQGQTLVEIESNKALVELPSEVSGTVSQIFVSEGQSVEVGKTLLLISPERDSSSQNSQTDSVSSSAQTPSDFGQSSSNLITLPSLGEGVEEGEIISLEIKIGDSIEVGQILMTVEMNKTTVDFPSEHSGLVEECFVSVGQTVKVGTELFRLKGSSSLSSSSTSVSESSLSSSSSSSTVLPSTISQSESGESSRDNFVPKRAVSFSSELGQRGVAPSLRKRARVLGLDLKNISGTGRNGRVTLEDFDRYLLNKDTQKSVEDSFVLPDFSQWGSIETKPYASLRKKTGDHLSLSWRKIPHVTQFDEADVTNIEESRRKKNAILADSGVKITPTVLLLKGVAHCLKKFPEFASTVDEKQQKIITKKFCHIGVAVDTPRGLVVPVIRDVDQKSVEELSRELIALGAKAKSGALTIQDLQGGVFTVSSLGHIGGRFFTPIINYPEVAILGVSRQESRPVVYNGSVAIRLILPYALSYDHRVIDGVSGVRFTRYLAEFLEKNTPFLGEKS